MFIISRTVHVISICYRDYNGPDTCITYDAVNAAYLDARKRISK